MEQHYKDFKLIALLFLLVMITGLGFWGREYADDVSGAGGFALGLFIAGIIYLIVRFNNKDK